MKRQSWQPIPNNRHLRRTRLAATEVQFDFNPDELSSIAEDMLDGNRQSVSAQELLTGLASSEAKGTADSKELAAERKQRFGVNRLPSRKEVSFPACAYTWGTLWFELELISRDSLRIWQGFYH